MEVASITVLAAGGGGSGQLHGSLKLALLYSCYSWRLVLEFLNNLWGLGTD
jgi:hypothetical protein